MPLQNCSQTHTLLCDVTRETSILSLIPHPHLPFLFGIHTRSRPYKIITQLHSLHDPYQQLLWTKQFQTKEPSMWLTLTSQMLEAVRYLHDEVQLINNDIKSNNILLTHSFISKSSMVQIVIVDFGKCTKIENRRSFKLSQMEIAEYMRMYPYMAQELIEGIANESPQTDIIYTVQVVLYCQFMTVKFSTLTTRNTEVLPIATEP